jgi:hypothetical protein
MQVIGSPVGEMTRRVGVGTVNRAGPACLKILCIRNKTFKMSFDPISSVSAPAKRVSVAVPVKIFSDQSLETSEWSCTYEISRRSARLRHVRCVTSPGQKIWIQRNNRKACFRVAWIGEDNTDTAGQFSADCLEDKLIWDAELQGRLRL